MKYIVALLVVSLVFIGTTPKVFSQAVTSSTNAGLTTQVAPGEILPVSVKLLNFGGGKRVDVTITYTVDSDTGTEIYKASETVAVETTNAFVKTIQIPFDASPGVYTAKTSILYQGKLVPAVSHFSFRVERKILGLFQNDFLLYCGSTVLITMLVLIIAYGLRKRLNASRFGPIDYSDIPSDQRVFYELTSDIVLGIRKKVGERALEIASKIEGLTIDEGTGRILKLTRNPSKIIAELVSGYEKELGEKVSFYFREPITKERR